jgi:hypothetical protein
LPQCCSSMLVIYFNFIFIYLKFKLEFFSSRSCFQSIFDQIIEAKLERPTFLSKQKLNSWFIFKQFSKKSVRAVDVGQFTWFLIYASGFCLNFQLTQRVFNFRTSVLMICFWWFMFQRLSLKIVSHVEVMSSPVIYIVMISQSSQKNPHRSECYNSRPHEP